MEYMEGEKRLLSSQLEEVMSRLDSRTDGQLDAASVREVMTFKKKVGFCISIQMFCYSVK